MLKIKDNVDLKKLEKYGFNEQIIRDSCFPEKVWALESRFEEYIVIENRIIYLYERDELYNNCLNKNILDMIYDLIKDGLIEKVEEN